MGAWGVCVIRAATGEDSGASSLLRYRLVECYPALLGALLVSERRFGAPPKRKWQVPYALRWPNLLLATEGLPFGIEIMVEHNLSTPWS